MFVLCALCFVCVCVCMCAYVCVRARARVRGRAVSSSQRDGLTTVGSGGEEKLLKSIQEKYGADT